MSEVKPETGMAVCTLPEGGCAGKMGMAETCPPDLQG